MPEKNQGFNGIQTCDLNDTKQLQKTKIILSAVTFLAI